MPLANTEHAFMDYLIQSQNNETDFLSELQPIGTLTEERQLEIYRSNINGAHEKVLGQVYPACKNILGEDYFNQLSGLYRIENPSKKTDLNFYGEQFTSFIQKQIKTNSELGGFGYLVDLALLEWHWHTSYFANDDQIFDFKQLSEVDADTQSHIIFNLSHSFSCHTTGYPLLEVWQSNQNIPEEQQEFSMPESDMFFCISRYNYQVLVEELTEFQFVLLSSIENKLPMSQLSIVAKDYDGNMQTELMMYIQKGWVTGFSLQDTSKNTQG